MNETTNAFLLPEETRLKIESYVWKHYPLKEWPLDKEVSYTFTPTNASMRHNGEGKWFVRVVLPSLHTAYGLFVYVWDDGEVGGVLEDDGMQKMFTFMPLGSSPVVTNWPTKPLDTQPQEKGVE